MNEFKELSQDEWFKGSQIDEIEIRRGEYRNIGKYYIEFLGYDEKVHMAKVRLFYDDIDRQPLYLSSGLHRIDNYGIEISNISNERMIFKLKQLRN